MSKPAPYWEGKAIVAEKIQDLKLTDYKGKYLILFFYPKDFTYVCPTEITAFNDRLSDFKAISAEIIGCSVDTLTSHSDFINTARAEGGVGSLEYPLMSDVTTKISQDYGVFLQDLGHTLRGLFIIDGKGILRHMAINDLPVGRSVEETLRLTKAFQYTDTHNVVCPIDWIPGSDVIIPDPVEKKKYFNKKTMQLDNVYAEENIPRAIKVCPSVQVVTADLANLKTGEESASDQAVSSAEEPTSAQTEVEKKE